MDQTTMSYAQLHEAYQALQEHVIALAGAVAIQPQAPTGGHEAPSTAPTRASVIVPEACLAGGGQMEALMCAFDWAATPLGAVAQWPQSLQTAVSICQASRFPIVIYWGAEYITVYNDAYSEILAQKHPWALGRTAREVWAEIWDVIGPMLDSVSVTGQATWSDDLLLLLERYGYPEECYFSFSFSPIRGEYGRIGGVFTAVTETTQRVLGERRLRTLRDLAAGAGEAKSGEEACSRAAATMAGNPADLPFALLYLCNAEGTQAQLAGLTGLAPDTPASPRLVDLTVAAPMPEPWPLGRVARTAQAESMSDLEERCGLLPGGPWPESPHTALVLPITSPTQGPLAGFLVAGVSPRRALDDTYRTFLELVAGHVATAIANARAYEAERRRAEALAEIDRAKTAFFSNVSHEFRTPLTLILGPVEDLLAAPTEQVGPAHRELLTLVHRNGLRLQRLVNTLLDFSRIEAGRMQAVYEPTDLVTVTADLASAFRSACEQAGLRLVVDCAALPEPVYVDRDMWEKIVLNLLSNAFKFTFAGDVVVTLRPAGAAVELVVRDSGIGIPAAELPHLFERFYRVEGARGRTHEGTGIGLALVQDLVQLHGGSVRVESTPGQGSTFRVVLPTGTAHLPADRVGSLRTLASTAAGASPYVEEALRWLPEASPLPHPPRDAAAGQEGAPAPLLLAPPRPPLPHTAGASSGRARILWADDNADMRDYVRRLLSTRYEVEAVADGEQALAAAYARRPDLLLADVMMPQRGGFAVLRALRTHPELRTLPVILLSARAGEEARIEGLEAGADAYLIKPFSARELLAYVEAHLELGRLRVHVEQVVRESAAHITRLNAHLQADLTSMTRLQQVSTRLVQTREMSALLDEILDAAIEITGADMGNIQLRDGDTLTIVTHRGFDSPFLAFFNTVHAGLAACGAALQRGERVIVDDVAASPLFTGSPACDVMLAAQARAVQSTPLITRTGRLLGMFSTHYRTPQRPAPRALALLDLLARQAADFIERAQAEDSIHRRTAQFETLLNAAPLGVYVVDADFRIRQVNPTAQAVFGAIPDLLGGDFAEVIHHLWSQEYADEIVRLFRHTLDTGEPYITPEHSEERRDRGVTESYEWQIHRIPLPDGRHGVVCYFRDISTQVLARQAMAASEARYRTLAATLDQRVQERTALLALIQDVTRAANEAPSSTVALQYALDRLCAYTGWPVGHVYLAVAPGVDRWAPTPLWHLDDPERFAAFQQATQVLEVVASANLIGQVGCGQPAWLREVATDPAFQRRHAAQAAGLRTGMAWPLVVGHEVAGVLEFYTPEPLPPNPALLEVMTQIGLQLGRALERERAAAQAQRQHEALLQREKLAAMSTMLASVAHELNNPLASIGLQAELLRDDVGEGPLAEPVAAITQAAARCERLVRQFLTLAREHPPERSVVALNTLVAETVELLVYAFRVDTVSVHLHLDDQVPPLWGDPHQLQQVLLNLLTNAQHALRAAPGAREVTLTTQYDAAQQQITLMVADTGPGIPLALQTRIFEPFFTTKPPGVGTGLGLPLCRGIVEAHGGTLDVTSGLGLGATFRLTLPVGTVPTSMPAPPPADEAPVVCGQRDPGGRRRAQSGQRVGAAAAPRWLPRGHGGERAPGPDPAGGARL